jgi:hypothetical protein
MIQTMLDTLERMVGAGGRVGRISALVAFPAIMLIGCDDILDVEIPRDIVEATVTEPALANLVTVSVLSNLECGISSYVASGGLFGNELSIGSSHGGTGFGYRSSGNQGNNFTCIANEQQGPSAYGAQYTAMAFGKDMTRRLEEALAAGDSYPDPDLHLAYRSVYTAYAITMLGEGYCRAVVEPNGPALSRQETLRDAEVWFTKALGFAEAINEVPVINMARLGRARVRLNLGETLLATEDALLVDPGFVFMASRSNSPKERSNQVWMHTWFSIFQTVDVLFRNLQVDGEPDPRVDVKDLGSNTTDDTVPAFFPVKHELAGNGHRIASWEEAQLIIAEAQLGQVAVDRINELRQMHDLPDFTPVDVSDDDEILNQVLDERAREFFLEGRLLGDMVRFHEDPRIDLMLLRFQEGLEPRQVNIYRENYCIPLSDREIDNNPNVESTSLPRSAAS